MKKNLMVALVVALVAVSLFALVACNNNSKPDENVTADWKSELNNAGKVVIGYTNNAPIGITNDDGSVTGFDIELAKEVFANSGVTVETKLIEWGSKEMELNSGKIDLVWNGLTVTPERQANMQISANYLVNEQAIVVKDATVAKVADLVGKKVAVENGSAGLDALDAMMETNSGIEKKVVDSQIKALTEVKAGTSDVAIIDSTMAGYLINKEGSDFATLKMVTASDANFAKEYYGVAAKKGKMKLINFINEGLKTAETNKKYSEIATKYGLQSRMVAIEFVSDAWKSELNNAGKVVIGYTNNAPMGITNNDGSVAGFDIELAKAIFSDAGIKVETKLIEWGSKEMELNSGKIDLVWNGLTVTPERQANMEISKFYLMNEQAVVVKAGTLDKVADLVGKKVAVENGSAGLDAVDAMIKTNSGIEKKVVDSQIKALTEVKAGTSDVAIIDSTMAGYLINKEGSDFAGLQIVTLSDSNFEKEYYGVAAKKGKTGLIGFINSELKKSQTNGIYDEITTKYGLASRKVEIK